MTTIRNSLVAPLASPSYRRGIEFIALNDGDACASVFEEDGGHGMVAIMILAYIYGTTVERVATDLRIYLRRH